MTAPAQQITVPDALEILRREVESLEDDALSAGNNDSDGEALSYRRVASELRTAIKVLERKAGGK